LHLGEHACREIVGDAVRVHGDQADLALVLRDCRGVSTMRACGTPKRACAPARSGRGRPAWRRLRHPCDRPLFELLAVDGIDEAAAGGLAAEDAEQPALLARHRLIGSAS
jgi:hypothetical protein